MEENTETISLDEIRVLQIAHTDTGDHFIYNGELKKEFLVKGKIIKIRSGLIFLDLNGEKLSTHKKSGFEVNEEIIAYVVPKLKEGIIEFTIRGIEKL